MTQDTELEVRHTVDSLFALKVKTLGDVRRMEELDKSIHDGLEQIHGFPPYRLSACHDVPYGENRIERYIDRTLWYFLAKQYELEKYMLATKHKELIAEIENCYTPCFTVENVSRWLEGLQDLLRENVQTLVRQVFRAIIDGTYYVGGRMGVEKKRNNNGVDATFILYTLDNHSIGEYGYYGSSPTITDDLEKVCYLLDGKTLPKETIKDHMRLGKTNVAQNAYMSVKVCQNGNTHYALTEETRQKINLYGPEGAIIGENIKIKIVDRWGR